MTKYIRVENADTSNHKVRVYAEEYDITTNGWVTVPTTVKFINNPTDMETFMIYRNRRIIIEEIE